MVENSETKSSATQEIVELLKRESLLESPIRENSTITMMEEQDDSMREIINNAIAAQSNLKGQRT